MRSIWMFSHFVSNLVYITIGGVCFSYLEKDHVEQTTPTTADIVTSILQQLGKWWSGTSFINTEIRTWISNRVFYGPVLTSQCYNFNNGWATVYPKKYAHGFVVLCFVVVMQSFIVNSHEVFIHIRVALLALGQSLDCHSASEVSLMDMGKSVYV